MTALLKLPVLVVAGLVLASCGGSRDTWDAAGVGPSGPPDFAIRISPTTQDLLLGEDSTFTVTVTSLNGYSSPVQLSGSGLYGESTYTFVPASVTPTAQGVTSTLTVFVDNSSPTGDFTLTVTGTGPSTTHSTTAAVTVGGFG